MTVNKIFLFFILFLLFISLNAEEVILNGVAMKVNGDPVTFFEIKQKLNPKDPESVTIDTIKSQKERVMNLIVSDMIVKQAIKEYKITISDEDTERAIENVALKNNLTKEQLEHEIKKQGVKWEDYKKEVISQLEILKLRQKIVRDTLSPDEAVLRSMYEKQFKDGWKFTASHILIKADSSNAMNYYKQISDVYDSIANGKISFEDAAKMYSQDGSAADGGKLGTFDGSSMVPEFTEALKKLKPGEISKPFLTQFGWHIAKLDSAEKTDSPSFESVKDKLTMMYYSENQGNAFESWFKEKRNSGNIELFF